MATTVDAIRDRVSSLCASDAFQFVEASDPFDFERQPVGQIDQVFRITAQSGSVIGGFNYSEERTDLLEVWLARKQAADPREAYRLLATDVSSIRAAVVRDGAVNGGDYIVPDEGAAFEIVHDDGREYAVLRLTVAVNFEAQL